MDSLTLREQVGVLASSCLRRCQELQRARSGAGSKAHAYVQLAGGAGGITGARAEGGQGGSWSTAQRRRERECHRVSRGSGKDDG